MLRSSEQAGLNGNEGKQSHNGNVTFTEVDTI